MDNDEESTSSPIKTQNKPRKSDEPESNDSQPEPGTSSHLDNNNNSPLLEGGEQESTPAIGDGTSDVVNSSEPLAPPIDGGGDADSSDVRFRSRSPQLAEDSTPSTSSSSSTSDSLEGVLLRETTHRSISGPISELDGGSSDSNVHISAPEFELDSSITSDSDANYFDEYPSSNDEEPVATDDDLHALNEVMNKEKPPYSWVSASEIMHREHGLSGDRRRSLRNGISTGFQKRLYASRHVVEKMKLLHSMHKHSGCVNCLNFNRAGNLISSGSDDMKVIVWDWASNKPKFTYKSGHTENIFQTKFVEMNGCMDMVSTSRDGQVRGATIPQSGGKISTRLLYRHNGAVHKLALCPQNPFLILSAGEDGKIVCCDLRKSPVNRLKTVKEKKRKVPLCSIAHHPFKDEICVCGNDNYVRVYDKKNMSKPVHKMCPQRLVETAITHITCCVYNSTGSEILASYSDDDIYLFENNAYTPGHFKHRYRGHYNHKTIKGVNFFGPNSEYVISGSDCGNIFFWDKNTEAIINFMAGDNSGVVNCLEPHPSIPILATSGLDHNIKIWAPNSDTFPPTMIKLEKCVKKNLKRSVVQVVENFDDRQFYYFVRQFLRNSRPSDNNDSSINDPDVQISNSSSSGSEEEYQFSNDQIARALRPSCNPQ